MNKATNRRTFKMKVQTSVPFYDGLDLFATLTVIAYIDHDPQDPIKAVPQVHVLSLAIGMQNMSEEQLALVAQALRWSDERTRQHISDVVCEPFKSHLPKPAPCVMRLGAPGADATH